MKGIVSRWLHERGFGFVKAEDGNTYFIHWRNIIGESYKHLENGQEVTFETRDTDKGPEAYNLVPGSIPEQPPKSFKESIITKQEGVGE